LKSGSRFLGQIMRKQRSVLPVAMLAVVVSCASVYAQDVPGIEICTAEKTMERRTSCLQSNVNFLQQSLTKQSLAAQQKLDAANREIESLKGLVAAMRNELDQLKATSSQTVQKDQKDRKEPEKK
jgi:TolA-binding protein